MPCAHIDGGRSGLQNEVTNWFLVYAKTFRSGPLARFFYGIETSSPALPRESSST